MFDLSKKPKDQGVYGFIYLIKNQVNGKVYIGQTIQSVKDRWICHYNTKSQKMAISKAFQKYGKENFEISILSSANNQEELNKLEIQFIQQYNSLDKNIGYNIETGGQHFSRTPEQERYRIECLRKRLKEVGRNNSTEALRKCWEAKRGKPVSEEQRKKLSEMSRKKPVIVKIKETQEILEFQSAKECAKYFQLNYKVLNNILRNKNSGYKHLELKYKEE